MIDQSKAPDVLCRCLDILELMEQSNVPEVLCRCLDILNQCKPELAAAKASQLMEKSKDYRILCRCLDILNSAAASWALKSWRLGKGGVSISRPMPRCNLSASRADRIITQIVNESVFNFYRLGNILMVSFFGNHVWERRTDLTLRNWKNQNPRLVNSCLLSHKEKPELTRLACAGLLDDWEALVIKQRNSHLFLPGMFSTV
ncbi:MAG: hypothetical protein IPM82_27810 [Saprospiraceae bacterium]|nr:hypothetical protein [Saprospiraceae bacterium]